MIVEAAPEVLIVRCPAKLNLFLETLHRRTDAYHELETLMVTVDLFDTLIARDDPSGAVSLVCDDPALPVDGSNLVIKAAEALKAATGTARGASLELRKVIPAQAGLGGGSSDAAGALVALDRLWGLATPSEHLASIASTIGSDVPFFLLDGPCAIGRGRGEVLEPVSIGNPLSFVLLCPPLGLKTADVYAGLTTPDRPRSVEPMRQAIQRGEPAAVGAGLFNRLMSPAEALRPELIRARAALGTMVPDGLCGASMTGSGSAYFGVAPDRAAARKAAARLEATSEAGRVWVVSSGP